MADGGEEAGDASWLPAGPHPHTGPALPQVVIQQYGNTEMWLREEKGWFYLIPKVTNSYFVGL